jgi:uncharacterized protein YxjI
MRYVIRQKLISFGDDYTIKDQDGRDVYFVDGRAFTDKLSFQDMKGKELAFIQRRGKPEAATFEIHRGGELFATVTSPALTFGSCHFHVDVPGPDDYDARGELEEHEFVFERRGQKVATVSRKAYQIADTYVVDVVDGEDDVVLLASAVVLDLLCDQQRASYGV